MTNDYTCKICGYAEGGDVVGGKCGKCRVLDDDDETWLIVKASCLACDHKWLERVPFSFDRGQTIACPSCKVLM